MSIAIKGAKSPFLYKASHKCNTMQLTAVVSPANATNKQVTWHSGSPTYATVDRNGLVTFHAQEGTVTFVARAADGSGAYAVVSVEVAKNVTSMRTSSSKVYIQRGKSMRLPLVLDDATAPGHEINSQVAWKSSNAKALTVTQGGKIRAAKSVRKKTKVTVTATAANGRSIKWTVTVLPKAKKLKRLKVTWPKKARMKTGQFYPLKARTSPAAATGVKLTYKSSNPAVVHVDDAGRLWAKKNGKAVITVKAGKKKAKKRITVR
jgi:alpha-L-fucosidase 2